MSCPKVFGRPHPGRLGSDPGAVAVQLSDAGALGRCRGGRCDVAVVAALQTGETEQTQQARKTPQAVLSLSPSSVSAAIVVVVDDGVGPTGVVAWATPAPPNSRVKAVKDTPRVLRIEFRSKGIESVHGDREKVSRTSCSSREAPPPMTHWSSFNSQITEYPSPVGPNLHSRRVVTATKRYVTSLSHPSLLLGPAPASRSALRRSHRHRQGFDPIGRYSCGMYIALDIRLKCANPVEHHFVLSRCRTPTAAVSSSRDRRRSGFSASSLSMSSARAAASALSLR